MKQLFKTRPLLSRLTVVAIALLLLTVSVGTTLAQPNNGNGNGPNNRPFSDVITAVAGNGTEIHVRIDHRANLGQFFVVTINGAVTEVRTQTGTFVETINVEGYAISLSVQGNSLRGVTVLSYPVVETTQPTEPPTEPPPYWWPPERPWPPEF